MRRWLVLGAALLVTGPGTASAEIRHEPSRQRDLYRAYLDYALGGSQDGLQRAVRLSGETSFLVLEQAELAGRRGDHQLMLELAEKAATIDPTNRAAHELLARTCFRLVEAGLTLEGASLATGIRHAETFVELGGSDADLFELLVQAHAWAARIAQSRGERAQAAAHRAGQRRALEAWVDRLHQERARELLLDLARESGDMELEARCLRESRVRHPDDVETLQRLGELLRKLGRCEEALPVLQQAAALRDVDDLTAIGIHVNLARCANEIGFADAARTSARRALELDPTNLLAAQELADAWLATGDAKQAADAWESIGHRVGQRPRTGAAGGTARRTAWLEARARWELDNELFTEAAAHAREALALMPAGQGASEGLRSDLQELVATILLRQGALVEAEQFARAVLQAEPGSVAGAYSLAEVLWSLGRGREAQAVLEAFGQQAGQDSAEHWLRHSRWALSRGMVAEAADSAHRAAEVLRADATRSQPVPVGALAAIGETLLDAGRPDEAKALLEEALEQGGPDLDLQLLVADALVDLGLPAKAEAEVERALGGSTDPDRLERRARWEMSHRLHAPALAHAQAAEAAAAAFEPLARSRVLQLLGEAQLLARDNAAAAATLARAAELRPKLPRGLALPLARALERTGRAAEGAAVLERALGAAPRDNAVALERARLLVLAGRRDEGVALARLTIDRARQLPGVHRQAALLLDDAGARDEALAVATEGKARFPEDPLTWLVSGSLHERRGDLVAAEADFRKVLELDPRSAAAWNALGYMFADHSLRLDEAVTLLEKATALQPHEASYLDSLAWARFRQGRLADAAQLLEQALARQRDPVMVMHLGTVREAEGRSAEALELYREALRFGLDEDVARVEARVGELAARGTP